MAVVLGGREDQSPRNSGRDVGWDGQTLAGKKVQCLKSWVLV